MKRTLLSILAIAAPLLAGLDDREWQYQRKLTVVTAERLHAVVLDRAIYTGAQPGLADLRLALQGREIPFVLASTAGAATESELAVSEFNRVVVPGRGLQLTLDAGEGRRHNRLRIATRLQNFRIAVKIETSDDGRAWAVARSDGSLFDFTQADRHAAVLSLDYPPSTRRYVRATLLGWMAADAVSNAWLTLHGETATRWQTLATAAPARLEKDDVSNLTFDLGACRLPFTRIRLESTSARFYRACDVESSKNGTDWDYVSTQVIYRLDDDESLALSFTGPAERFVRLRIRNGQDQPLTVPQAAFETVEQTVRFLPDTAGDYTLYYGNEKAQLPAYDLGMILARRAPEEAVVIAAGPQELNPSHVGETPRTKPWSDRHPEVLYVTLGLAVLAMGWYCLRFLREIKRAA